MGLRTSKDSGFAAVYERGACRADDVNPDWFFPDRGGRVDVYDKARTVCRGCPVRIECLEFALANESYMAHGMFGGLTPGERRRLRQHRRTVAA